MKWYSFVSENPDFVTAIREAAHTLHAKLNGATPHLLILFVSGYSEDFSSRLPFLLKQHWPDIPVIGCTSGGVIGGNKEIEHRSALSLCAALLPDVQIKLFHLETEELPLNVDYPEIWHELVKTSSDSPPHFILLSDPFSFDIARFLQGMDKSFPQSSKIGGLASRGRQSGENRLFLGDEVFASGLVGLSFSGNIEVDTLVAQGCRPIGHPMFVTRCQNNLLLGLDGRPPMQVLEEIFNSLSSEDQQLMSHSLFLGIAMRGQQKEYHQGDFLIRNLLGADPNREGLLIGAFLKENHVVQFHLRDSRTSKQDLKEMLIRYKTQILGKTSPAGALLFSCLGRGVHLYGEPDHDSHLFQLYLGQIPIGGFFCNGEIGPVHRQTFLHGYTASFAIFRKKIE